MNVAACPIWVASYGVIPHAYVVAAGPAAATASSPEEVSNTRGSGPCPGSSGMLTPRQESMSRRVSRPLPLAGRVAAAMACTGDRHGGLHRRPAERLRRLLERV